MVQTEAFPAAQPQPNIAANPAARPDTLLLLLQRAQRPRSAARAEGARMNTPNVHAGRLERRVRRVGSETMPGIHRFCSLPLFFIRRITSLYPPYGPFFHSAQYAEFRYCALPRYMARLKLWPSPLAFQFVRLWTSFFLECHCHLSTDTINSE